MRNRRWWVRGYLYRHRICRKNPCPSLSNFVLHDLALREISFHENVAPRLNDDIEHQAFDRLLRSRRTVLWRDTLIFPTAKCKRVNVHCLPLHLRKLTGIKHLIFYSLPIHLVSKVIDDHSSLISVSCILLTGTTFDNSIRFGAWLIISRSRCGQSFGGRGSRISIPGEANKDQLFQLN